MAQKGLESLIHDLQKTIITLSQKVNSLEVKVDEQNVLITTQIEVISKLKCYANTSGVVQSPRVAEPASTEFKALQRPVRQVRLKPSLGAAASKRRNVAVCANVGDSTTIGATPTAKRQSDLDLHVDPACVTTPQSNVGREEHVIQVNNNDDEDDWQKVTKRSRQKNNRQKAVIRGSGIFDSELQTVERVRKIHVCFFKPDTSEEALKTYMVKKSPYDGYVVNKLKLKHNHYASFVITVPHSKFDFFMSADNWPERTEISEWFRRGNGRAVRPHTEHVLRGHTESERVNELSKQ